MGGKGGTAGHAFISYAREDSADVDRLQRVLQAAGVPVWRDTADLWPGEDWRDKIRRALVGDALLFVACFSTASVARRVSYQNEEILLAIERLRQRPPDVPWLIPVRFDDCLIPDVDLGGGRTLRSIQRADLFGSRLEEDTARLVEIAQRITGSRDAVQVLRDPGQVTYDFFISHASADRAWAEWVAWELEEAGYRTTLQSWAFRPGENFVASMSLALEQADRIVAIVSPAYVRSALMLSELETALRQSASRIVPVVVEPAELPAPLATIAAVDLVATGERTSRERLLRGVLGSGRYKPRDRPDFPGIRPPGIEPSFPPELVTRGSHSWSEDREPTQQGMRALVISAESDAGFARDLSDALVGLRAEFALAEIGLHVVPRIAASSDTRADPVVREADIVLIVVSRDLLATEYGLSADIRLLIRKHDDHQALVFPVLFRSASWEHQPFGLLAPLPSDGVPVMAWPRFDEAIKNITDGLRIAISEFRGNLSRPRGHVDYGTARSSRTAVRTVRDLGDVFKPAGVPFLTFVEPDDFAEFRMALRQPGLGIVLEGPSGIGKTTILRHAAKQDADRLGEVRILSARRHADVEQITRLPDGHVGLVAIDDFHRLPNTLQDELADYLKRLADDDSAAAKLVIVGIPDTAQSLVAVGADLATRIRVFSPGTAAASLVQQMIEKGEAALNIAFDRKAEIVRAAVGSLLTAQMLCWQLAMMAGVEQTVRETATIPTNILRARARVTSALRLKYQSVVHKFAALDGPAESLCIDLLLRLAEMPDGVLRLDTVCQTQPSLQASIERVFINGLPAGLGGNNAHVTEHIYYDPRGRRLIVDDPQFIFYIRQLSRDDLLEAVGKQLPVPRDQVFVCYSHKNTAWLERLQVHLKPLEREGIIDLWSDLRLELGDQWRKEISKALARAKVALLLVSADFMASDFINRTEVPELLAAAEGGGCRIIPVLVAPSLFMDTPALSRFQHANSGKSTLSEMKPEESERALANLAHSLIRLLKPQ